MKTFLVTALLLISSFAFAASNVLFQNYTVTAGSTTAFQQLTASTPITVSQIYACDSSASIVEVAVGAAGSEVPIFVVPTSACAFFNVSPYLSAGSRVSIKGLGVSNNSGATTGTTALSLLP